MPISSVKWDPYDVLEIDASCTTCYGWAPSKNRQCQNPVALANRQEAQHLLRKISRLDLTSTSLNACLRELAHRILCQRNHQGQAAGVVRGWKDNIKRLLDSREEEEEELTNAQMVAEVARLTAIARRMQLQAQKQRNEELARAPRERLDDRLPSTRRTSPKSSPSSRNYVGVSSGTTQDGVASRSPFSALVAPQWSFGTARQSSSGEISGDWVLGVTPLPRRRTTSHDTALERTTVDAASSVTANTLSPSGPETPINLSIETSEREQLPVETSTFEEEVPVAALAEEIVAHLPDGSSSIPHSGDTLSNLARSVPRTPASNSTSPDTAVLVHQRSLSGDCAICYEDLLDGRNLTCCKAQCKQYFHQKCIRTWLQQRAVQSCPYWYVACFVYLSLLLMAFTL